MRTTPNHVRGAHMWCPFLPMMESSLTHPHSPPSNICLFFFYPFFRFFPLYVPPARLLPPPAPQQKRTNSSLYRPMCFYFQTIRFSDTKLSIYRMILCACITKVYKFLLILYIYNSLHFFFLCVLKRIKSNTCLSFIQDSFFPSNHLTFPLAKTPTQCVYILHRSKKLVTYHEHSSFRMHREEIFNMTSDRKRFFIVIERSCV